MKKTAKHLVTTKTGIEKTTRAILWSVVLLLIFVCPVMSADQPATGQEKGGPFPSYGTGKTVVRIYTDYFCPPCRATEPELELLLIELVKSKKITVIFVDTPIYKDSPFYTRYFLYALNKRNDFEYALHVRSTLFTAAKGKTNKEALEEFLKMKGIAVAPFDAIPVLTKLNTLLQKDKVDSTPTCVIVKDGKTDKRVGGAEILKGLRELR